MATAEADSSSCAHCGLPLAMGTTSQTSHSPRLFCCHACRLAAALVGGGSDSRHSWRLLRLGLGGLLAMNIMMVSMLLYTGGVEATAIPVFRLLQLALATPALALLLPPLLKGAVREVSRRHLNLHTLVCGGSLAAYAVSALHTLTGRGEIYFDTATMLPALVTVGHLLESTAKVRAADLLHSLETLLPATALRMVPTGTEEVSPDRLQPGDLVRVRPGERIPVDGCIVEGSTFINEASFTGEFLPRQCGPGDPVMAGTVNGPGSLLVETHRAGAELLLKGIVRMVEDAWRTPSRSERLARRMAALFIPVVLTLAIGTLLWWVMSGNPTQGWLSALAVLVVACPCTMGIATPLATSLAMTRAARAGMVVRGGGVLECLGQIDLLFFDKTGTITCGQPQVEKVCCLDPAVGAEELLGRVATLESASEHVLARAVIAEAGKRGIESGSVKQVAVSTGIGISGAVTWRSRTTRVAASRPAERDDGDHGESGTVIEVRFDDHLVGRLLLSDGLRHDAAECVHQLRQLGIETTLLSGDSRSSAAAMAARAGITFVHAPRTPAEKLATIAAAITSGRRTAMVGDGINDAPALAAAQVGIALGAGMQLAQQAGKVVLLSDMLIQLPWLIRLSRATCTIIRWNFAWSFGYNAIALAAAAAGLLHPLLAATAMVVSSITVLANSLRIMAFPDPDATMQSTKEPEQV